MIPASFRYRRAASLDEALQLLSAADPDIKPLAGGQSLLALMKLRLARPGTLVDIGRLAELRGVRERAGGRLGIGALTTWDDLLGDPRVMGYALLRDAIPMIGDLQVRNRGTIGGSLAHADPASDIAAPALALSVELVARSTRGERVISAGDFYRGPFETALAADEILTEIRLPAGSSALGSAYRSLPQPASGYPIAGVAAVVGRNGRDHGPWAVCAVAVTGVGEVPYRAASVERAILDGAVLSEAVAGITDGQEVASDIHADVRYRTAMAQVMARRALEAAIARVA